MPYVVNGRHLQPAVNDRTAEGKPRERGYAHFVRQVFSIEERIGPGMSSHAFHQLYYHFVWATKQRAQIITGDKRDVLIRCLQEQARQRGGIVLACNAMPDHVHLAVTLPPTIMVSTYIGQVKGSVAFAYNQQFSESEGLSWQEGYGVITFRKAEMDKAERYVENQQELHEKRRTSRWMETASDNEMPSE